MKAYYYIPLQHEVILTEAVNEWTSAPNYGWTIITGVYELGEEQEGNSTVVNVLRKDRLKQYIPYSITNTEIKQLIGFTLEGDLDLYAPAFKSILIALEGVIYYQSNSDYLNYLNSLNQR